MTGADADGFAGDECGYENRAVAADKQEPRCVGVEDRDSLAQTETKREQDLKHERARDPIDEDVAPSSKCRVPQQ
jgi:hypothetical protein